MDKLSLMIAMLPRGMGAEFEHFSVSCGIVFSTITMGRGTAGGEMLEWLGLADRDKDVCFAIIPDSIKGKTLSALASHFMMDKIGNGIAFTIPLSSIAEREVYEAVKGFIGG